MRDGVPSSLAFLAIAVGLVAVAQARGTPAAAPSRAKAAAPSVQLHRCTDAGGKVTWQDDACPAGSKDEVRRMLRPSDPPPKRVAETAPAPKPVAPEPEPAAPPARELIPPPPMYLCTSYDGIERYSESYDPNPRCEPMVLYYPYPNQLTPAQAQSCRWVEDSCVRLSDGAACERWRAKQPEAASLLQRAFSDTVQYRRSELARINQILDESCR
jgi:hypothetical protein